MIRYALKCSKGHSFESWFQSAEAYETLSARDMVACSICGSTEVTKAIMAPRVSTGGTEVRMPEEAPLSKPSSPAEQAIAEMRKHVEENADYVGSSFVREARAIHEGEAPDRAIWGEARLPEAKALLDEGVPVAPLPFAPTRKAN